MATKPSALQKVTGPPALAMIRQAGIVPGDTVIEVLDNACGTAVVAKALYEVFEGKHDMLKIICGDTSPQMLAAAVTELADLNVEVQKLDAQAIDIDSDTFTHVLTNFGFQAFSQSLVALREAVRVTKHGGLIGSTTWIEPGWAPAFRIAASRIPGAPVLSGTLRAMVKPGALWHEQSWILEQLQAVPDIDAATINIQTYSFETFWDGEEAVREAMSPLERIFGFFIADWTNEQKKAAEGKLFEGTIQAILEEPRLVWQSLITTANKKTKEQCQ
ncbi:S-adenosyl-L-methionine-dependent methyltransferase [Mycena floridula]|nr:S-adenosyl-L-methionine-dependent methyltransferase [Mycena floridula]